MAKPITTRLAPAPAKAAESAPAEAAKKQNGGWVSPAAPGEKLVSRGATFPETMNVRITNARIKIARDNSDGLPKISDLIRAAIKDKIEAVHAGTDHSAAYVKGSEKLVNRNVQIPESLDLAIKECQVLIAEKTGKSVTTSEFLRQALEAKLQSIGV